MRYRYGDAWERYPIEPGQVWGLADGSKVAVHDIFDPLPPWMHADLLFVDLPYTRGQLSGYYAKAGLSGRGSYNDFTDAIFRSMGEIGAQAVYIEIGGQMVEYFHARLKERYSHVQRWPVTYYHCYPTNLLRGSQLGPIAYDYSGLDEAGCIRILARIEEYRVIADPCMGQGLVGLAAYRNGQRFVGTELNKRRLAVLLDRLAKAGGDVKRLE